MPSWDLFVSSIRARFQPVSTAAVARRQLDQLRQGPTQNVNDYVANFRRLLVAIPNMEEGDRMHCFVRGLRSSIANQVLIQRASNLTQAIEIATFVGSVGSSMGVGSVPGAVHSAEAAPMELSNIEGLEEETEGVDTKRFFGNYTPSEHCWCRCAAESIGRRFVRFPSGIADRQRIVTPTSEGSYG